MPRVSVIICARNAENRIGALIENLAVQAGKLNPAMDAEIVLADSASTDRTAEKAEEAGRGAGQIIKVIRLTAAGKVKALNAALGEAQGGILAFLDDDVRPQKNWLKNLVSALDGGAGLVGGKITADWTGGPAPSWFTPAVASFTPAHAMEPGAAYDPPFSSPVGANFAVKREVFEKIGPFDESLGHVGGHPYGAEENELAFRAAQAGFRLVYEDAAAVAHPFCLKTWTPSFMVRRAFHQGVGAAVFFKGHGIAFMANPWLSRGLKRPGGEPSPKSRGFVDPKGKNAFYFVLKTTLYAGYLHGCIFR